MLTVILLYSSNYQMLYKLKKRTLGFVTKTLLKKEGFFKKMEY